MKTGKEAKINLQELYEDFSDSIYRQITMDTTAIDEYFATGRGMNMKRRTEYCD